MERILGFIQDPGFYGCDNWFIYLLPIINILIPPNPRALALGYICLLPLQCTHNNSNTIAIIYAFILLSSSLDCGEQKKKQPAVPTRSSPFKQVINI
jgi:hypothetical protein